MVLIAELYVGSTSVLMYSTTDSLTVDVRSMGWDTVMTNLPYGHQFRNQRRLIQDHFNQQAVIPLRPHQRKETCTFLLGLLNRPWAFEHEIKR